MRTPLPTLYFNTVDSLPTLTASERVAIAASADAFNNHALAKTIEVRQASAAEPIANQAKVIAWNAWCCKYLNESADLLAGLEPDILLLSEMDYGMDRSGQRHTTAELAERLGYGYVYGIEYIDKDSQSSSVGYRGNAILSRAELKKPAVVRFNSTGLQNKRYVGSRLAVLATVELAGQEVVFASVHVDNMITPQERGHFMESLLDRIEEYAPQLPVVVGGDMNTLTFAVDKKTFFDPDWVRKLMAEDSDRISNPIPHEPLFSVAENYGYDWRECNIASEPTQRALLGPTSLRAGRNVDWLFTKNLRASEPAVIDATPADVAFALSDHEIISVSVETLTS